MSPRYIGIDPDTKNTAVALVDIGGRVEKLGIVKAPGYLEMLAELPAQLSQFVEGSQIVGAVVEGQEINYRFTKRPNDIVKLAQVAGGCAAVLSGLLPEVPRVAIPVPKRWKGNVPKQIHHGRILRRQGWGYEKAGTKESGYCVPTDSPFRFGKTEWKHLVDAIGLACWAKDMDRR